MSQFMVWSRIEVRRGGGFVAIATALPCNAGRHRAPEERKLECDSRDGAEEAAARLARALFDDIHAQGRRASRASELPETSPLY
jgi:hypothetical protein